MSSPPVPEPPETNPPECPQRGWSETRHGVTREDPYHWLMDPGWREVMAEPERLDADIRAYLEAENAFCETAMAPEADRVARLFAEMKGRIKEDDWSYPRRDGAFEYYRRSVTGGQHWLYCRRRVGLAPPPADGAGAFVGEELLHDANAAAAERAFYKLATCRHSPDHRYLALAVDTKGSEYFRITIKDLEADCSLPDSVEMAEGSLQWAADGRSFLYCMLDSEHRPHRVYRHILGEITMADTLVYEEKDKGFFVSLGRSEDGRFITLSAHDHATSEVYLVPSDDTAAAPQLVAAREPGVEYQVSHLPKGSDPRGEGALLIRTNAAGAVDFKLCRAPLANPGRDHWEDIVPPRPGRFLVETLLFRDHLVRLERVGGLPRIVVAELAGGEEHEVAFEEAAYDLSLVQGYEFATGELRFKYQSMTTPGQLYAYDMAERRRTLLKADEVPSGHDPERYETFRLEAASADGAEVPVSILKLKSVPLDGSAPLLLYGYGAYGMAMPAGFSGNRLSLVDRGFVYAIAHVRGGSERGYGWYLDGKLEHKENTFNDFVLAAEKLIEAGYSLAGRIAAHGGSAGGMLMGVVANRRPDLFGAILAEVPFVDVLNTMCDGDLPLTPPEWPEWGNPIADAEAYARIAGYSPYDQLAAQVYPAIFATGGLTDPRVTYWEPAKWIAKLRRVAEGDKDFLLRINMKAGHGGASGRFDRLEEVALLYAFALKVLGVAEPG